MRRWGVIAAALVIVFVAACSGDDSDDASGESTDTESTTTASSEDAPSVRMIALNQLHGLFCPAETDFCDAPSRLQLLWDAIEAADCPEIVGLAEIGSRQDELIPQRLPDLCDGKYELLYSPEDGPDDPVDEELVLTSLDVVDHGYVDLANFPWSGYWAQVESDAGVVDFIVVHQASGANNPPCTAETCPPMCPVGEETGTCNTRELIAFLDANAAPGSIQVVSGDLNKPADDPRITPYFDAGFEDASAEADNALCGPDNLAACTCCISSQRPGEDYDGAGLDDPSNTRNETIDFVLVRNASDCEISYGEDTGIFAGPAAATPVNGVYWPSDHAGVYADLRCS